MKSGGSEKSSQKPGSEVSKNTSILVDIETEKYKQIPSLTGDKSSVVPITKLLHQASQDKTHSLPSRVAASPILPRLNNKATAIAAPGGVASSGKYLQQPSLHGPSRSAEKESVSRGESELPELEEVQSSEAIPSKRVKSPQVSSSNETPQLSAVTPVASVGEPDSDSGTAKPQKSKKKLETELGGYWNSSVSGTEHTIYTYKCI